MPDSKVLTRDVASGRVIEKLIGDAAPGSVPLFIQPDQPSHPGPYKWVQINVGGDPGAFTEWFHDGVA